MIPTATTLTEIDNLPGKETAFRIGNPAWVMRSLSGLYSDVTSATIREYSTNAMDSHIMSGQPNRPIHVTLPDMMNPYFVVQDFGLGLSTDELEDVYTSFGDSLKRESADTNGIMGFGCKSAMAYTNQFTVVAIKDGIKTHGIISKRPDFTMKLKTVSIQPTDEDNGVTVTIPVHNYQEFRTKAKNFYRFWLPGTVLVDGVEPEQAVGEKIEENLYFSANPGVSYVVMGNVGYRIANPEALFRNRNMTAISFVAYVGGGAVHHTPSREDLDYDDHTKAALQKVVDNFESRMMDTAKAQITGAANPLQAWKFWTMWSTKLGQSAFAGMEYKGIKLSNSFPLSNTIRYKVPYSSSYNSRYNTETAHSVNVDGANKALWVTEFEMGRPSSDHKRKARTYAEQVLNLTGYDNRVSYVYFMKGTIDSPWVDKDRVVTWEDLKAALPKAPKKVPDPNRPRRPKGLFDYYDSKGNKVWEKEIPVGADVFYVTAQDAKKYEIADAIRTSAVDSTMVVVVLAVSRIEKFKRDNFGARDFVAWAKAKVVIDGETLLDDRSKLAMNLGTSTLHWVNRLDETKIDDPKWALVKELTTHRKYTEKYENNITLARSLGMRYDVKEWRAAGTDDSLVEKYPLLHSLNFRYNGLDEAAKAEVILYINAAFAAKKGK